jgi:hypothetical protein
MVSNYIQPFFYGVEEVSHESLRRQLSSAIEVQRTWKIAMRGEIGLRGGCLSFR